MTSYGTRSRHVFVDESGDPNTNLAKSGVSTYFVLTAVVVESDRLEEEESKAREIAERYFRGGEIKSSRIANNVGRRLELLKACAGLRFRHYSQVIDKALILSDSGLNYRKSFVKFINRILYERLFESLSDLHVIADEHGTSEFMASFAAYLDRYVPRRLFEQSEFTFGDSCRYPLIQVADLVAGSIHRCYAGRDPMSVLEPIRPNTIIIDEWPPKYPEPLGYEELSRAEQHSYLVRQHAVRQANAFIEERSLSEDEDEQAQVSAVRYLLYHFRSVDPESYITSTELRSHLHDLGFDFSQRGFWQRVVARLRDENVFIASSRNGLKIPYSVSDLRQFVERVSGQVVPYMKRLERCREHFVLASNGDLDIISDTEFPDLARYLSHERHGRMAKSTE